MMDGEQYRCLDVATVDVDKSSAADRCDGGEVSIEMATRRRLVQMTYAVLARW